MSLDIKGSMPSKTETLYNSLKNIKNIKEWTLVGGTALAIHIKHRTSEDLDFFINRNKINSSLKRKIDEMLSSLESLGYSAIELYNEDEESQLDYEISGVKVTFCITSSMDLKKDTILDGNIEIASLNSIAAMKMYTLLKYRIKSRDFYDIKYLIEDQNYSIEKLVSNLQEFFPHYKISKDRINNRFTKSALNSDDEGFDSLLLSNKEDFNSLRMYFKKLFSKKSQEEAKKIETILSEDGDLHLIANRNKLFDLTNNTLGMKLLELNELEKYEDLISKSFCFPESKNLEGKTVFDILADIEQLSLFDKTLNTINSIPKELKTRLAISPQNKHFLEKLEKHKIINRCLKKDTGTTGSILENQNLNKKEYTNYINSKRLKLESIKNMEEDSEIKLRSLISKNNECDITL